MKPSKKSEPQNTTTGPSVPRLKNVPKNHVKPAAPPIQTVTEAVRVQKLLAGWGLASRRTIEEWILAGRIKVDGVVVKEQGLKLVPGQNLIEVDGQEVRPPVQIDPIVLAYHKPVGFVSTLEDPFSRPTILEHLPQDHRLFPIGRLDLESSGLLLVTNYGEMANRLLHPRYKVDKEYEVIIDGQLLSEAELKRFAEGLPLDDGMTAPCEIRQLVGGKYAIILREGRKRQIRRMLQVLGRQVKHLHRSRFGPIELGRLKPGETRPLNAFEMHQLLKACGLQE